MIGFAGVVTRLGSGVYIEVILGSLKAKGELDHSGGEQEQCGETHLVGRFAFV